MSGKDSCHAAWYRRVPTSSAIQRIATKEASHHSLLDQYALHIVLHCFQSLSYQELPRILPCLSHRRDNTELLQQTERVTIGPLFDGLAIYDTVNEHPRPAHPLSQTLFLRVHDGVNACVIWPWHSATSSLFEKRRS
jgi:hypothetical protein